MNIDKQYQIEAACCDAKQKRPALETINIGLWQDKPVAIAADGVILVIVPITLDEGDVPGMVPAHHFTAARTQTPKYHIGLTLALGADTTMTLDGATRPRKVEGNYPDYTRIIPALYAPDEQVVGTAFNVERLGRICKALGYSEVALRPTGSARPIMVKPLNHFGNGWTDPPFGLIMPLHVAGTAFEPWPVAPAPTEQPGEEAA